jgi:AcrR family transcriptional regulator
MLSKVTPATPSNLDAAVAAHRHGRVPAELRREQILVLAAELFAERGFAHTSMDTLAQRAGVTKPVIYTLVGSKDELFRQCVRRAADALAEAITTAVDAEAHPAERMRVGAKAFFDFVADSGSAYTALLAGLGTDFSDELAVTRRRLAEVVTGLTARGLRNLGHEPDPAHIEAVAHLVNGALESLALWWADHPERSADELADLVARFTVPGIVALVADPPPDWSIKP